MEWNTLFQNYPVLKEIEKDILEACEIIIECYKQNGKLLICGNGGSAADSEHIAGELMKGFLKKREIQDSNMPVELRENLQGALPAISLTGATALSTAFANDVNPDYVFAQQAYGLGHKGDVLIAISTSGNAANVCHAVRAAQYRGMKCIALTGKDGGRLGELCELAIKVPSTETYRVQEYHLPVYHTICAYVEKHFYMT